MPRRTLRLLVIGVALMGLVVPGPPAHAAVLPTGFVETLVASGLSNPTAMALAPDGRIFVGQQNGQLRVIKNSALLATPFLTVPVSSVGERGLLGVAFDPQFAVNQFVYVYYTATTPTVHNRVSRFQASGDVAAPGTETILLELNSLSATNHNGGAMHFGADGKLYIATGENAVPTNAQTLANLLGKILRINADPTHPDGLIPPDNPFVGSATGNNRAIWALGLRNPFTFAFQPGTSRMFINDVGQDTWEEINDGIAGANYGWPNCEGNTCSSPSPTFRAPLFTYANGGSDCAITGGAFYNPPVTQFPTDYVGDYFFADFCGGWIRRYDPSSGAVTPFATGISSPVDLKVGPDGSLYYLARGSGSIFRVQLSIIGGRNLRLTAPSSGGVQLAWDPGFGLTGYAIYRFGDGGEAVTMLPGTATTHAETPPGTFACYFVLPLEGEHLRGRSDLLCLLLGVANAPAPQSLTIRLNQGTTATLSWPVVAGANGYALYVAQAPERTQILSPGTTSATDATTGFTCYALLVSHPTGVGNSGAVCGAPGQALGIPEASRAGVVPPGIMQAIRERAEPRR
jgi:glucose/arabinose dehydrogenase